MRYLDYSKLADSQRIMRWVNERFGGESDLYQRAKRIEDFFQNSEEFTYEIGAPRLDDEAPISDFIFVEKKGHCGRYASALAAILRTQGIPSRVCLGFLPQELNTMGDF